MSGMNIDASDLTNIAQDLGGAPGRIGATVAAALRAGAFKMERTAKMNAPVDTGALRNSISTTFEGNARATEMAAEIGPTVDYGLYVEEGTSRHGPQPYLGPAWDQNITALQQAVSQAAGRSVLG